MTRGFLLNNQLTDFSAAPTDAAGLPIANAVAAEQAAAQLDGADAGVPHRRPTARAATSPWPPARRAARPSSSTSLKTLVGTLDWGLDAQQAVSMIDFGAANSATTYGRRRASERRRHRRRRQRPAGDGAAQPRPHGVGGGAVERARQHRPHDGRRQAGLRRRRRPAARGHRARRYLHALSRRPAAARRAGAAAGGPAFSRAAVPPARRVSAARRCCPR